MRRPRKSRQPIGATSSTGTRTAARGPTHPSVPSPSTPPTMCSRTRLGGPPTIGSWRQEHHRHRPPLGLRPGPRRPEATAAGGRQARAARVRRAADRGGRRRDRRHHRRPVPGIPGELPAIGRHLRHPRLTARAGLPAGLIQPRSRRQDWDSSLTEFSHGWCGHSDSPHRDSPPWPPSSCERQLLRRRSDSSCSQPRTSSTPSAGSSTCSSLGPW
jgi:hypothetical protein